MLHDIYNDNHPNIIIVGGRQVFKTTFSTDILSFYATKNSNIELVYCVDNKGHRDKYSIQRLRRDTFLANPTLKRYLPYERRANVEAISLKNGSVIYLVTDQGEYNQAESTSPSVLLLNEAQNQDLQYLQKALYALTQTKGRVYMFGIGGEAGSAYHRLWERTDQREWVYKDKFWYEKIRFDRDDGHIINENLDEILAGRWVAQKPQNTMYRGYHLPQTIFPQIPRTVEDAIERNVHPELSIEHQQRHNSHTIYTAHCLGEFYKAERQPISPAMVHACMDPYKYIGLLSAEVREMKNTFGKEVRVLLGVDWGSGKAQSSATHITIMLHWRKSGRYQIAWTEKRPFEHGFDQCRYIVELARSYSVDFGVVDLGYGQDRAPALQTGGEDSKGNHFDGLWRSKIIGCRTQGATEIKPEMQYREETDEHGTEHSRIQVDKTTIIQNFIDFIGWHVAHPSRPDADQWQRPKLMIPYKYDYETDFFVNDMCSITRVDMEKEQADIENTEDKRQHPKKQFSHPSDSVMSIIYCKLADDNFNEGSSRAYGVGHVPGTSPSKCFHRHGRGDRNSRVPRNRQLL